MQRYTFFDAKNRPRLICHEPLSSVTQSVLLLLSADLKSCAASALDSSSEKTTLTEILQSSWSGECSICHLTLWLLVMNPSILIAMSFPLWPTAKNRRFSTPASLFRSQYFTGLPHRRPTSPVPYIQSIGSVAPLASGSRRPASPNPDVPRRGIRHTMPPAVGVRVIGHTSASSPGTLR